VDRDNLAREIERVRGELVDKGREQSLTAGELLSISEQLDRLICQFLLVNGVVGSAGAGENLPRQLQF
jgi:hypothetical protein